MTGESSRGPGRPNRTRSAAGSGSDGEPRRKGRPKPPDRGGGRPSGKEARGDGKGPPRRKDDPRASKREDSRPPKREDSRPPKREDSRPPRREDSRPPRREDSRPPKREDSRPPKREPRDTWGRGEKPSRTSGSGDQGRQRRGGAPASEPKDTTLKKASSRGGSKKNIPDPMMTLGRMRLQKFLSRAGRASRRDAEDIILAGRVKVNNKVVTELGVTVDPAQDRVLVDDVLVQIKAEIKVLLVNKPKGVICTRSDPEGRRTIYDMLGSVSDGLATIGRLDFNTEGVILLTNDGDLSYRLTRPEFQVRRVYRVRVRGPVDEEKLVAMTRGVETEGEILKASSYSIDGQTLGHLWMTIELTEGKNRHVRRMLESVGLTVARLLRVRFAGVDTGDLKPGEWRWLEAGEIKSLDILTRPPKTGRKAPESKGS